MPAAQKEIKKEKKGRTASVLREFTRAGAKYPWLFAGMIFGALLIEGSGIGAPLVMSRFVNSLSDATPGEAAVGGLFFLLILLSSIAFIGWIGQRVRSVTTRQFETNVMRDLSNQAFGYLIRHSHGFFISNFTGGLTRKVNRYGDAFESLSDVLVENLLSTLFFAAGVIITLSTKNLWLGLGLLAWCIVMIWVQFIMTKWRQSYRLEKAAENSRVTGLLSDSVTNQSTITLFATADEEAKRFREANERLKAVTVKSWRFDSTIYAVQGIMAIALEFALLGGGIYLWSHGIIHVGDFVLIQVYMLGLVGRIWGIGSSMRRLYSAFADADEMVEILETPHEILDRPGAIELKEAKGEIAFQNVSFSFNENAPVLKGLTLQIPAGQKVALVGPSGAGKTTVTKLLLRLYDVTGGAITLDGTDIRDLRQESLRSAISFVPQDPILFHRSLKDNIRYGREDATDEEVIAAAKKAHCHEFISKLPEGYETYVGERGVKLSGGERQRVAIARAVLKNAPILVLDEATSSLDSESEQLIQDALKHLMVGKTVIVIAHRLSTIMEMDRIIVMQDGTIAADGTHRELLAEGELYHKLWSIQAGGFIADETLDKTLPSD